ncbi:MAG: hypothetical protein HS113_25930 [Verrucomicrobiales bacterium]|nr:hypothetical protein [Verrucomicrobiales bacterium]
MRGATEAAHVREYPRRHRQVSGKPGINAEYLKPDLDASQWVERFEREGREIYDHRERIADVVGLRPGMRVADIIRFRRVDR